MRVQPQSPDHLHLAPERPNTRCRRWLLPTVDKLDRELFHVMLGSNSLSDRRKFVVLLPV